MASCLVFLQMLSLSYLCYFISGSRYALRIRKIVFGARTAQLLSDRNLRTYFSHELNLNSDLGCAAACQYQQGQYKLQFARDQQYLHLQLTYFRYPAGTNTWTGVAFGQSMNDGLDFIGVRVLNNKVLVSDEFVRGFRPPKLDVRQNIIVQYASLNNGNLRVRVSKPIFSNDTADFSLASCLPWQFPIALSPLDSTGQIHKHQITPRGMVVCIDRCPCGPTSTPNQCQL